MKPIRLERFIRGANRAYRQFQLEQTSNHQSEYLFIKVEYKTIKVLLQDVLFIEGLKDYVKVHTTDKMHITRLNVKGMEELLPHNRFLRIHKSFIVALDKIHSFQKGQVFIEEQQLPVGATYQAALEQAMAR